MKTFYECEYHGQNAIPEDQLSEHRHCSPKPMKPQTQHTPGPWKFNVIDSRGMIEGRDQLVAYVDQVKVIDGHLLAAAPELLEAAKKAVELMKNDGYAWKHGVVELREAISKAEGR